MATIVRKYDVGIVGSGPVGLLLSNILSHYGINHVLIERRAKPVVHPQAHFLGVRTMEILQSCSPKSHSKLLNMLQNSDMWREFSYCHSLTGTQLQRIDHFAHTPLWFWNESPTNFAHLAQNKVETVLRNEVRASMKSGTDFFEGYNVSSCTVTKNGSNLMALGCAPQTEGDKVSLQCKYLVGADGANSFIRNSIGISMQGDEAIQHLVNVHFSCPGLRNKLKPNTAMLYFVFNEAMVGVYVAHDASSDEWVCQIPYFPPFQTLQDFTPEHVKSMLEATIFACPSERLPIELKSINSWVMHAEVASQYSNFTSTPKSGAFGNVFLVGDAAHRFPPSGGFGMNTGLQDAHNLAWKLALVNQHSAAPELLKSYEYERKPIAEENTRLSKFNYNLTAGLARALGVDPELAALAVNTSDSSFTRSLLPFSMRRAAVLKTLQTGLYSLKWLRDWQTNVLGGVRVKALQQLVSTGKSLPLIFPETDLGFIYPTKTSGEGKIPRNRSHSKKEFVGVKLRVGGRIPHCWLLPSSKRMNAGKSNCSASVTATVGTADAAASNGSEVDLTRALSTVQLPTLLEHIVRTFDERIHKPTVSKAYPALLVIVSAEMEGIAIAALEKEIDVGYMVDFVVVSVKSRSVAKIPVSFIQSRFQDPYYQIEGESSKRREQKQGNREEVLSPADAFDQRLQAVFEGDETFGYHRTEDYAGLIRVDDVTGTWASRCEEYTSSNKSSLDNTGIMSSGAEVHAEKHHASSSIAVVVRPDGHVADIIPLHYSTNKQAEVALGSSLRNIASNMCLYRADGLNM